MMPTIKTFLTDCLVGCWLPRLLVDPYRDGEDGSIFFGDLPRDFLKDNSFAAQCLVLQDRKTRDGSLIDSARNVIHTSLKLTRRRYRRELLFRCLLHAETYADLWGSEDVEGLVEQFERSVAARKWLSDSGGSAIRIELQDATRPWGADIEADRIKRRPHLAIIRVSFKGGLQITKDLPIISGVEITPTIT
jgi:hypothetical protein